MKNIKGARQDENAPFYRKKNNTLLKKNNSDPRTLQHVFNFEKSFKDLETNEKDVVWENCF